MMKHIKIISLMISLLVSGAIFSSCGDDEPEFEAKVYLAPGASSDIVLDYQDNIEVNAVVFNSTSDWAAEIFPANSSFEFVESKTLSKVDWLEINPFRGGAGEIRCTLFSTPNHTHENRYAVIRVSSPTNSLLFKVTQKGMAQGGGDTPIPNPGD